MASILADVEPAGLLGERGTFSPASTLHHSCHGCPSVRSSASPQLVLRCGRPALSLAARGLPCDQPKPGSQRPERLARGSDAIVTRGRGRGSARSPVTADVAGVGDDVAKVMTGLLVERTAAGNQPQRRPAGVAEDLPG